ncbi:hypothetical protein [Parasulfitobacter algicola]|uniref:Uncharacterized protein n=1 Tax=Parasulfitobacter algicola TaxID=2614809 RepID=A0ABX2IXQ6_9RHOB|nr:hypothetical protein [Sulfitobacter algicola]NSX55266.1 hypothetical protein [Sulfitobacter algicola]
MNMTPNFWAEMIGVVEGFILPEIVITVILAVIAALSGGTLAPWLVTRIATFTTRLTTRAGKLATEAVDLANIQVARCLGVIVDIINAFRASIAALGKIGCGLHKTMSDMVEIAANGTLRTNPRAGKDEFLDENGTWRLVDSPDTHKPARPHC